MNKYQISLTVIGILVFAGLMCVSYRPQTSVLEWHTFADRENGWEISYPPTVTDIQLADDAGPRNWLDNVVFKTQEKWMLTVWVGTTTAKTSEEYTRGKKVEGAVNEKVFTVVDNGKVFIIRTNLDAPTKEILKSFKTEN